MRRPIIDTALWFVALAVFVAVGTIVGGDALVLVWVLFGIFALLVAVTRTPIFRRAALLLAAMTLPFALIESALLLEPASGPAPSYRDDGTKTSFLEKPAPLGYRPNPSQRFHARKFWADGRPIYDVTYTIDANRLRETPGGENTTREKTALFFGGSMLMGEGVEDDQTLPYYYAEATNHEVRSLNFGVMGYGTHQMLRALELELPTPLVEGRVVAAYYLLIPAHLERIVNESTWGHWDPRYRLARDGGVQFDGHFAGHSNWLAEALVTSRIRRRTYHLMPAMEERKLELMMAIIEASRQRIADEYGASLEVLMWGRGPRAEAVVAALEIHEIPYRRVTEILGDLEQSEYHIEGDGHPTPLAHRLVGYALAGRTHEAPNQEPSAD